MPTETLTILLVEDNPQDACLVQEMLQAAKTFPFQLIQVSRLEEALTCLSRSSSISVILLDWSLPDAQGAGMITQLRRVSLDTPILVINDWEDEAIALQALQTGAQDYLVKHQTDSKRLVRSIRHAIAREKANLSKRCVSHIRTQQEQSLRESEAKFRTLYESTSTAVILLDEKGIFDGNSAALRLFGCTHREQLCGEGEPMESGRVGESIHRQGREEVGNFPCSQSRYHPVVASSLLKSCVPLIGFSPAVQPNGEDSYSLANEYITKAIAQGSCRFDWMYCKQNGEEFPAEVTLTRIELGKRKILQATIYDISDRKATERQLLQAKEAAEAGSRAKSEFLAMMSHELRTPLNAVLGLSQLMRQEIFGTLNEKQKEYVSCIQSSGEHLLALINDILDLSKVEAGKEQLTFVPLDIQDLCDYCLAMVREQAHEQGLKLKLQIDPQARILIADERRCKQMLLNLLSNAVKFTPMGEVLLSVTKRPISSSVSGIAESTSVQEICFTVKDTGIGIASHHLPLLFEPFRQLDSGLNRQFTGTGLGLALTRSLARLHGGEVIVQSNLGEGSQFTLCLPDRLLEECILPSLPQDPGVIQGQSCPLWAKSRILLVETDERSALILKDYLQVIGHRVEHLIDGQDFLHKVRQFKPSLILMDVQLRGEYTGFDLLAALRREPDTKNLKVVMVTAMAMAGDRERCLEAGANEYLSKPIGIAQLEAILMRFL
ncbi:response regulator [Allocoleopsis franciscana]|uniref:Circadian input-output histidine kinase CikA n=1 Tax=Allocoleopsis franciscana PCC 7113 TaxID=1173027 RepID=K9WE60_9CYAN|nr:response regulator [Allocoleopsis franciscana]AFZ18518.1 PAS domain S-box [Allocoleopsis franciscana PCC 7113]